MAHLQYSDVALPEPGHALDLKQVFFTNLQLLGFDPVHMEKKLRIPFNKDMFLLPNKHGFETVVHFLFNRLDPVQCREKFRDCWPVGDKKQEQLFRKVCTNWMTEISKEDVNAHMPRISASLFMSPGGEKFYQMLYSFSLYVLHRWIRCQQKETDVKMRDVLQHPVLPSETSALGDIVSKTLTCGTIQYRKQFLQQALESTVIQTEWKKQAREYVKENRSLTKTERDIRKSTKNKFGEIQEKIVDHSSSKRRSKGLLTEYDLEVESVKRAQKVQKARDLWKQWDSFSTTQSQEKEIVSSILERALEKYKLDATDIDVKIPDLLLRECEKEIQRRNVENIYQGGKLNILSVVHLWNLSLHLYIERLHQAGVPNFETAVPVITSEIHTHQALLTNAQHLSSDIEGYIIPEIKTNVSKLKARLDGKDFLGESSEYTTNLSLVPPTPPINFDAEGQTPKGLSVPTVQRSKCRGQAVTPEAVSNIIESVQKASRVKESNLVQGSPFYGLRHAHQASVDNKNLSKLPKKAEKSLEGSHVPKPRTRYKSAPSNYDKNMSSTNDKIGPAQCQPTRVDSNAKITTSGTTMIEIPPDKYNKAKTSMTAQVVRHKPATHQDQVFKAPVSTAKRSVRSKKKTVRHSIGGTPEAMFKLEDSIVDSIMKTSPNELTRGDIVPDTDIFGADAFKSKDKISRSPLSDTSAVKKQTVQPGFTGKDEDRVVTRLFSEEHLVSDEEDNILTVTEKEVPFVQQDKPSVSNSLPRQDPFGLGTTSGNGQFHSITSTTEKDLLMFSLSSKQSSVTDSDYNDTLKAEEELLSSEKMPTCLYDNENEPSEQKKFLLTLSPDILKSEMEAAGYNADDQITGQEDLINTQNQSFTSPSKNVRINSNAEVINDLEEDSNLGSLLHGNRVVEFQNGKFSHYLDRSLLSDEEEPDLGVPNKNISSGPTAPLSDSSQERDTIESDPCSSSNHILSREDSQESSSLGTSDAVDDLIGRYKQLKMNILTHESGVNSLPTELEHPRSTREKLTVEKHSQSAPAPVLEEKYLEKSPNGPASSQQFLLNDDLFAAENAFTLTPAKSTRPKKNDNSLFTTPVRGLSSLPVSPGTSFLHGANDDLLDEDDSILLPSSPAYQAREEKKTSPVVAKLIDL